MGFNLPQMFWGAAPYTVLHGPDIAPGEPFAGRTTYEEVVLTKRLREPLARINPKIPAEAIDEAILKVLRTKNHTLEENAAGSARSLRMVSRWNTGAKVSSPMTTCIWLISTGLRTTTGWQ
jgi:hypothetical protein